LTRRHTDSEITRRIGANLKALRKTRGLSQGELGAALGITFQQIEKYEHGTNRISTAAAVALARALEIDLLRLFAGCDDGITEKPFQAIEPGDAELIAAARPLSGKGRRDLAHLVTAIVDMRIELERHPAPICASVIDHSPASAVGAAERLAAA
jgi:transcriptional regulator with XRE-family HTH domain